VDLLFQEGLKFLLDDQFQTSFLELEDTIGPALWKEAEQEGHGFWGLS
jgi:hypothetical protein